jgi:tetratricopeptide (TPR) repeat protein
MWLAVIFGVILPCLPLSAAKPPWLELHSSHFTVITDAGEKRGREVALRFEQMRAVFGNLLSKNKLNQSLPLTILALKNDKSFYQVAPLHNGQPIEQSGFFIPGGDQGFFVLNLSEPEPWRAVAHDLAHFLLDYNYPPAPGWFDEGLAEYFSSIHIDSNHVEIGGDPELTAPESQDLVHGQRSWNGPKSLAELLGAQVWLSIPDLFTMKHDTSGFNEGTHHTLFYAESWILMHYLIHENKLPETGEYLGLVLMQKVPVEEAIQKAYGMDSAQFEKAVKDYFHALHGVSDAIDNGRTGSHPANPDAQVYQQPLPVSAGDSAITVKPLFEPDARALYAGVQVRIRERREAGLKELQTLASTATLENPGKPRDSAPSQDQTLTTAVGDEIAHRALAWDDIQHDKFDEALTHLRSAAALAPQDMWIRFYLSVLKYRVAQSKHADIQGLANMMQDLRAVLDWYPEFAEAYDLLAVARNEGGGPTAALEAERAAIQLSPRDQRYVYHLGLIYVTARKWDEAIIVLNRVKNSDDPRLASQAKLRLDEINNERKYGISASAEGGPKLEPQKSPFDVLEQDAAKRAAAEQQTSNEKSIDKRETKFFKGRLLRIDCAEPPSATLTVSGEGRTLTLRTADYKSLLLIGADQFSCDWSDRRVSVNYKPSGPSAGDLISLEVR